MERERERQKDLMKGYGHEEPAPIYIHYQCFAFPRVPWRKHLLAAHNLPPLPLSHCSFIPPSLWLLSHDPQESPHKQVFSVKQPAEREKLKERELAGGPNWAQAWEGEDLKAWCWEPL